MGLSVWGESGWRDQQQNSLRMLGNSYSTSARQEFLGFSRIEISRILNLNCSKNDL